MNRLSHILGVPYEMSLKTKFLSKSHKLFTELGLVHFNEGFGTLMPMITKALRKMEKIVHHKMREISALEVRLPKLINSHVLEKSERLDLPILFKVAVTDNKNYILSPTCEEAMAHLLQSHGTISESQLPISFYQISTKFRNEYRPKSGLLRAKEFVMKDLYVFDSCANSSEESYQKITQLYCQFFDLLKIPYYCVEGNTGDIGGLMSHEYHFLSEAGEDKIILCSNCGHNENLYISGPNRGSKCRKCESGNVQIENGIEVGHTFSLGTKFTQLFNSHYEDKKKKKHLLHMCSFGLGLTRIIAASVEVLCKSDKIIWPLAIAPFSVCLVPPKAGSKEENAVKELVGVLYQNLNQFLEDDVIVDDRTSETIGKRLLVLEKFGFPFLVIIGKGVLSDPPTLEVIESATGTVSHVRIPDVNQFILNKVLGTDKGGIAKEKISI